VAGARSIIDPSLVASRDRSADVEDIRRDVARIALARNSISVRSRIRGCLGMVVALFIVGLVLPAFAGSNAIALLLLAGIFIWLGGYVGAWLVVRSLAR
jgi:hypothetical protein